MKRISARCDVCGRKPRTSSAINFGFSDRGKIGSIFATYQICWYRLCIDNTDKCAALSVNAELIIEVPKHTDEQMKRVQSLAKAFDAEMREDLFHEWNRMNPVSYEKAQLSSVIKETPITKKGARL